MSNFVRKFTAAAVAMSLVTIPTASIAATPAAPQAAPTAVAPPANAWLSLSAMTANSSSGSRCCRRARW
jgi:hypothetical protein